MPLVIDPEKADILVILDIHNFMLRCYFAKGFAAGAKNKQKYPTGHVYLAFQKVRAALNAFGLKDNKRVCLMLSAQENSHVRRKKYPKYKAQRTEREYESYDVTDPEGNIVSRTRDPIHDGMEMLLCFPCVNLNIPKGNGETDDAISVVVRKYGKTKIIYVVTEDHDAWAMMSKNVTIVSKPDEKYTPKHLFDMYGITNPKKLPLVKAILGDSSDNIENVPGWSDKAYEKAIASKDESSHYFMLHKALESAKRKRPKEKVYCHALFRELKKLPKNKKIQTILDAASEIEFRERLVRLKSSIQVEFLPNRSNIPKLKKLLEWYEIRKDFNSAIALASSV